MRTVQVEEITDTTEVYPTGRVLPRRTPDFTLIAQPEVGMVAGLNFHFDPSVFYALEITRRIQSNQHFAHVIQETWRGWGSK